MSTDTSSNIQALFNWSGGKDSALALYQVQQDPHIKIHQLLTSVSEQHQRISMHGVRRELLHAQAEALGLPLHEILIPESPDMEIYNQIMQDTLQPWVQKDVDHSIFGDIFLEDLRKYREDQMSRLGFKGLFPLWKRNTSELIREFVGLGFKTILVCVQSNKLPREFVGREIDMDFIKEVESRFPEVDICGENGEFHTFVYDGPNFKNPLKIEFGEIVYKEYPAPKDPDSECAGSQDDYGFYFQDLKLKG